MMNVGDLELPTELENLLSERKWPFSVHDKNCKHLI